MRELQIADAVAHKDLDLAEKLTGEAEYCLIRSDHHTALGWLVSEAASRKSVEVMELMVELGADVNTSSRVRCQT